MTTAGLESLKGTGTILLTTYKRDGTPVPTPVSIAFDGDRAFFRSYDQAWKTKRLRNNARVEIAPATLRGKPTGPAVAARATLLTGAPGPVRRAGPGPPAPACCRRSWCHSRTGSSTTRRCITNSNGPTEPPRGR